MESLHDLEVLVESGKRFIILQTEQEGCFIEGFRRIARRSDKAYFQWTVTQGLLRLAEGYEKQSINKDVNQLFAQIQSTTLPSVYVLVDFHHYLQEPVTIRHIKDVLLHSSQHCLVLLSQQIELPEELDYLATHYQLPLPTATQLKRMVNDVAMQWLSERNVKLKVAEKGIINRLVKNLCGLSHKDAERMARHAVYNDGIIDQQDIDDIAKQKFQLLDQDNILNFDLDYEELNDIAGFDNLKKWLKVRQRVFNGEVDLPGSDIPKGVLLLGVQGCGKSMAAKAVAGSWQLPLLHLDFGTLYNRFYGQTEQNLRSALDTAEKMAPCVLWLDEIEKGLSAVSSSDDVSKRMLGTFLNWLAENKHPVFVVATANDVSALPPELIRKGRFDEVFFVDLPDIDARAAIVKVHLRRRELPIDGIDLLAIAEQTEGFSGAELEQIVVSALYESHALESSINTALLIQQAVATQPLSILMAEKIAALRSWAQGRTILV